MGYPTKVQAIKRGKGHQWFVNFPAAIAAAISLKRSEVVEWEIDNKFRLILRRNKSRKIGS